MNPSGYYLIDERLWVGLVAIILATLPVGFALTRLRSVLAARLLAWAMTIATAAAVIWLSREEPAGPRMFAVVFSLLWPIKAVVAVESQAAGQARLRFWQYMAFAAAWPGMRPGIFEAFPGPPQPHVGQYAARAAVRLGAGGALLALAAYIWRQDPDRHLYYSPAAIEGALALTGRQVLATILALPALSLIVQFGFFTALVAVWRALGVKALSLFNAPFFSKSLQDFWGYRWNKAFTEMTTQAIVRPLRGYVGFPVAAAAAFLFSGLLHELAISVPVDAGYGLPTIYFVMHGCAMVFETLLRRTPYNVLANPVLGRVWTASWVIVPLPILFHQPFLRGCVWPLLRWPAV